jgi:hypothetical protein
VGSISEAKMTIPRATPPKSCDQRKLKPEIIAKF